MALPATHIRFAASIVGRLGVADFDDYLSGTLYPDSRWVTGIGRQQTHDERFLNPGFAVDDFTRGWHIHCVCDHIQGDLHADLFHDLPELKTDARWVNPSQFFSN